MKDDHLKKDMKNAQDLLELALCGAAGDCPPAFDPDLVDSDEEEGHWELHMELASQHDEEIKKTLKMLPKSFPYHPSFVDEEAYKEKPLFSYFKGPVYWMDEKRCVRVVS